ncbi:hypothetical protein GE21DRAFT_1332055 [Neurospora crassa]|nr:hypothetical protein GE21DRAFT_1332055 [Neurospora crassa]
MMMQHSQTQGPNSLEFKILRSTGNWERQVGLPTNTKVEYGIIGSFQSGV